jgi:hypothetical protein
VRVSGKSSTARNSGRQKQSASATALPCHGAGQARGRWRAWRGRDYRRMRLSAAWRTGGVSPPFCMSLPAIWSQFVLCACWKEEASLGGDQPWLLITFRRPSSHSSTFRRWTTGRLGQRACRSLIHFLMDIFRMTFICKASASCLSSSQSSAGGGISLHCLFGFWRRSGLLL